MPRSNKASVQHAVNVIISCLTHLVTSHRTLLESIGVPEGEALQDLRNMESLLPTLLNLRREMVSDTELESLLGRSQIPLTGTFSQTQQQPAGQPADNDNVEWKGV